MKASRKPALLAGPVLFAVLFAVPLLWFPATLLSQAQPAHTSSGTSSIPNPKNAPGQGSKTADHVPTPTGDSKLEIKKQDPADVTASDSPQDLSLTVPAVAEGDKITVSIKKPDGSSQTDSDVTAGKGLVKFNTTFDKPGKWQITLTKGAVKSDPYSLTVSSKTVCRAQPTATQMEVFGKIVKVMNRILGGLFLLLVLGLLRASFSAEKWSLGDALSEESSVQPASVGNRDQVVRLASSSRVIAVFGLTGILALVVGVGYSIIWNLVVCGESPNLDGIKTFLIAMAAIFAPYVANQVREAFDSSNQPPKPDSTKATAAAQLAITSVNPAVLTANANPQNFSFTGSEFDTWMSVTLVNPNGRTIQVPAPNVNVTGPTQFGITATLDRGGSWKAVATSARGSSAPFVFAVRAPAPVITGIAPPNPPHGAVTLTVDGGNFMPNATATLAAANDAESSASCTWNNVTQLQVSVTVPNPGQWRIRISNPGNDQPATSAPFMAT